MQRQMSIGAPRRPHVTQSAGSPPPFFNKSTFFIDSREHRAQSQTPTHTGQKPTPRSSGAMCSSSGTSSRKTMCRLSIAFFSAHVFDSDFPFPFFFLGLGFVVWVWASMYHRQHAQVCSCHLLLPDYQEILLFLMTQLSLMISTGKDTT